MDGITIHLGDCLDVLADLPDASVDAVVTDPPYGLEFMGKDWDSFKPSAARLRTRVDARTNPSTGKSTTTTPEAYVAGVPFQHWCQAWAVECLRVLKPGGHLVAFGGTRTFHRLACAIEDAGFEIRDSIGYGHAAPVAAWVYGSGFPKSLDVSKAIDKVGGVDARRFKEFLTDVVSASGLSRAEIDARCGFTMRFDTAYHADPVGWGVSMPSPQKWATIKAVLGVTSTEWDGLVQRVWRGRAGRPISDNAAMSGANLERTSKGEPATEAAAQWQGWGTALKPAWEPIVVARKPLAGTVAANVQAYGTGALNIDACRVATAEDTSRRHALVADTAAPFGKGAAMGGNGSPLGRWPANVVLSHAATPDGGDACADGCVEGCPVAELDAQSGVLTSGANPTRRGSDKFRDAYGEFSGQAECVAHRGVDRGGASRFFPVFRYQAKAPTRERPKVNGVAHPTVKPLSLLSWLVRLVTPPGGTVLEPFAGSGTTVEACLLEGFGCVAIEREAEYLPLIQARIDRHSTVQLPLVAAP